MEGDTASFPHIHATRSDTILGFPKKGKARDLGRQGLSTVAADVGAFCPHYYYTSSSSSSPVKLLEEPHELSAIAGNEHVSISGLFLHLSV